MTAPAETDEASSDGSPTTSTAAAATGGGNHNVQAFRRGDTLNRVCFEVPGKKKKSAAVQLEWDQGGAVLTIGSRKYVILPHDTPEEVVYDAGAAAYSAVVLRGEGGSRTCDATKSVILEGDGGFKVAGQRVHASDENGVFFAGKWHKPGDRVVLGGRVAVVKKA